MIFNIAICGVRMAESLLTGLAFSPHFIVFVGRTFVSGICKLKRKKTYIFVLKIYVFPALVVLYEVANRQTQKQTDRRRLKHDLLSGRCTLV